MYCGSSSNCWSDDITVCYTDLPINGDAYVQFTFPANDPAILQTFKYTRNCQNNSRDGDSKALHMLHTSGNAGTATDADSNSTVQVGQETQLTVLHTSPYINIEVEDICTTDGEHMEGEIGVYQPLTAKINDLIAQKVPAAHFRIMDALVGTHSPSQIQPLLPSRLDEGPIVYETNTRQISRHVKTCPEQAGGAFFKNRNLVSSLTCLITSIPSRLNIEPMVYEIDPRKSPIHIEMHPEQAGGSEEERIRIHLQVWANIQNRRYKRLN